MIKITDEMKELAKSAATAYVTGLKLNDMEESIETFLDAYDLAVKKIWLKEHKNISMREFNSDSTNLEENK